MKSQFENSRRTFCLEKIVKEKISQIGRATFKDIFEL